MQEYKYRNDDLFRKRAKRAAANVTYYYFNSGDGVATVAVSQDGEIYYTGVSFCSPDDQFIKDIGRKIAFRRMLAAVHENIFLRPALKSRFEAAQWALECVEKPQWARKFYPRLEPVRITEKEWETNRKKCTDRGAFGPGWYWREEKKGKLYGGFSIKESAAATYKIYILNMEAILRPDTLEEEVK